MAHDYEANTRKLQQRNAIQTIRAATAIVLTHPDWFTLPEVAIQVHKLSGVCGYI